KISADTWDYSYQAARTCRDGRDNRRAVAGRVSLSRYKRVATHRSRVCGRFRKKMRFRQLHLAVSKDRMKYSEIIADNLSKARWTWGLCLNRGCRRANNLDC